MLLITKQNLRRQHSYEAYVYFLIPFGYNDIAHSGYKTGGRNEDMILSSQFGPDLAKDLAKQIT
jgi:hypothetical protein